MNRDTNRPVRIAVAGAGLVGKRHAESIARNRSAAVSAIVDPAPAAQSFAAAGGYQWYGCIADMLEAEPPDGVVIATPNQLHVENGLQCVRAGVPVLVEKPIADTARSAAQLVEEADRLGVPVLVGHHRRHNPIIRAAHERIKGGDVGDIVSVQAADSSNTRNNAVEDTAAVIVRFEGGALGTITVSDTVVAPWSWELTAAENPAYPETQETCYFIGGTRGALEIPKGKIWTQHEERGWWQPIHHSSYEVIDRDPLDEQIAHFCRVITGAEQPLVSGREGLKSLQVVEAIKTAASQDTRVELA